MSWDQTLTALRRLQAGLGSIQHRRSAGHSGSIFMKRLRHIASALTASAGCLSAQNHLYALTPPKRLRCSHVRFGTARIFLNDITGRTGLLFHPQNMLFPLAVFSGMACVTSQCSTIFPSSSLKMSTIAFPRVPGTRTACTCRIT